MRRQYGFAGAVRGKYASRYAEGTNLIRLAPDLADVFPDAESVNRALRPIAEIVRRRTKAAAKAAK